MKKMASQSFNCIFVLLLAIAMGGCGLTKSQIDGINTFGKAAESLGSASKDQFFVGRNTVIEMRRQQLAMEKKILPAKKPDGSAADREFYFKELNLDSGLDIINIQKRAKAVDLLIQYGNLLVKLSEETQEKELTSAAQSFTDSLKNFPGNTMGAADIDGIGQLVIVSGKMWVESEKKDVLKKIIPSVTPLLQQLCDLLEKDFDLSKRGMVADIYNVQDRLATEAIDGLKREGGSLGDRLLLIEGFALADLVKSDTETTSQKLLKTVAALRDANRILAGLIENDKISLESIKSFAANSNELIKAVKPFVK